MAGSYFDLLEELEALASDDVDPETAHYEADRLLLGFIGEPGITEAFDKISKWYS